MILYFFFSPLPPTGSASPTSSLSSAWMKSGRANPTWASSVMRTRYSELLNFGALSFLSISRMVNVVITVASDGLRSSFSSVAFRREREESDAETPTRELSRLGSQRRDRHSAESEDQGRTNMHRKISGNYRSCTRGKTQDCLSFQRLRNKVDAGSALTHILGCM